MDSPKLDSCDSINRIRIPTKPSNQTTFFASLEPVKPLDIGSGLELAIDPRWIDTLESTRLIQHAPIPRETVLEGSSRGGYLSVLKDDDLYRMYYRVVRPSPKPDGHEFFCYAESLDARHWIFPELNLFRIPGVDDPNAITEENRAFPGDEDSPHYPCVSHNLRPFVDTRPGVPLDQKIKTLAGGFNSSNRPAGFWALASADGIHWKKIRNKWGINRSNWPHGSGSTPACTFWSEDEGQYVAFIRIRVNPKDPAKGQVGGLRWIGRLTSRDFVN